MASLSALPEGGASREPRAERPLGAELLLRCRLFRLGSALSLSGDAPAFPGSGMMPLAALSCSPGFCCAAPALTGGRGA
eukprot:14105770-Alexandrium_andersonii.AAC.1